MAEQGLVVVKENIFTKIAKMFKRIFKKECIDDYYFEDIEIETIKKFEPDIQEEIRYARSAFRKYVVNDTENIEQELFSIITTEIMNNQQNIEKIIEINEDNLTINDILDIIDAERKTKKKFKEEKNDIYRMPIGVVGIECRNTKECITYMLKAISTRNAIMILNNDLIKYRTEDLILLIIKQCLIRCNVDDDLIQMHYKEEIDLDKLDKVIYFDDDKKDEKESKEAKKEENNKEIIYMYKDSELFNYEIKSEYLKLIKNKEKTNREVKIISGKFIDVTKYLEHNKSSIVVIYTDNEENAYKLANWVNTDNVFVNTKLDKCIRNKKDSKNLFKLKKIELNF